MILRKNIKYLKFGQKKQKILCRKGSLLNITNRRLRR